LDGHRRFEQIFRELFGIENIDNLILNIIFQNLLKFFLPVFDLQINLPQIQFWKQMYD
jgi:hypothetical protein